MASTRTKPSLETLEWLLDEALEAYQEMGQLRVRLREPKRRGPGCLDLLPEIAVCASVITAKTEVITQEIDKLEDSMPDND